MIIIIIIIIIICAYVDTGTVTRPTRTASQPEKQAGPPTLTRQRSQSTSDADAASSASETKQKSSQSQVPAKNVAKKSEIKITSEDLENPNNIVKYVSFDLLTHELTECNKELARINDSNPDLKMDLMDKKMSIETQVNIYY